MKNIKNGGLITFAAIVAISVLEKILMDKSTRDISTETTLNILEHFNMIEKKDKDKMLK